MTTTGQNFEVYQGSQMQLTWNVDVSGTTTPQSLTGSTQGFWVFAQQGDAIGTAVLTKADSDISLVSLDDTDDGVRLTLDSDDTSGLTAKEYYYELWAKDASSIPTPLATGSLRVKAATGSV